MRRLSVSQLRAMFAVAVVATGLIFTSSASAHRTVTGDAAAAMRAAVVKHLNESSCPGGDKLRIGVSSVSSANPDYGFVATIDNSCTNALGYFLQRATTTSDQWHVVAVSATNVQRCAYFTHHLPGAVVTDYEVDGSSGVGFGTCITASTIPLMPTVLGPPVTGSPAVRPGRLIYTGDSSGFYGGAGKPGKRNYASPLQWSEWDHTQALASGNDWVDNCVPNCAAGTFKPFPITLKLSRPGLLDEVYVYTRLTVSFKGKLPPGQKARTQHIAVTYRPGVMGFYF